MNKSHHARHPAPVDPDVVRAEAAALRALYERYKAEQLANGVRVSQERFGDDHGIGSQGMVWQYLEGKRAVGLEAAERFARAFGVPIFASSDASGLTQALPPSPLLSGLIFSPQEQALLLP